MNFISAKENPVIFSESQFSQWQLHSWITKLTIIALSKNKQSTPQYAVNKLWKISKSPGPEGNAAGLQRDMANFYKHLNCDPMRSPSIALFALSVRCHLSLAYWTRGSIAKPTGELQTRHPQRTYKQSNGTHLVHDYRKGLVVGTLTLQAGLVILC